MAEIITNLHPDGDENTNLYPNIKKENIPSKSISTDKLDDNVLSLIGSLKPSGTDTSTNILAYTSNKGIYVATDNGHWYYWNGNAYADGGIYQSSEDINVINDTLEMLIDVNDVLLPKEEGQFINGKTIFASDGSIKDFAREFLENRQQKSAEQGITLQDIGKGTTKSFTQNPERAMNAMESLEYGVRTQEEVKEV